MNISLHPGINELDPESLCYSLYQKLYLNFFNAQDKKSESNPHGIVEGDQTSIRLHNTAYNFADAISENVGSGSGGIGSVPAGYLKLTGGDLSGPLTVNYGFEAGVKNIRVLEVYSEEVKDYLGNVLRDYCGIRIHGNLDISSTISFNNKEVFAYEDGELRIWSYLVHFGKADLLSHGSMSFGDEKYGVHINSDNITVRGYSVHHAGNSNGFAYDWVMKNATVANDLLVFGTTDLDGQLIAHRGVSLGYGGKNYMTINSKDVFFNSDVSFGSGNGIRINNSPVLTRVNDKHIQLGAISGHLILGSEDTYQVRLISNLTGSDSKDVLLTPHGKAYFPDGLTLRHNFGDEILATYRVDNDDEGVIIKERLRFGNEKGAFFEAKINSINFSSSIEYVDIESNKREVKWYNTIFKYDTSTSKYKPQNKISDSLVIETDADFIRYNKPIESVDYIGIDSSYTKLSDGSLFFSTENRLVSGNDGIKHFGNSYFMGDIGSSLFSSGFAGSGWAIMKNKATGNITATYDEITIRKKMRVYELEVQKNSATNGALWVSDYCDGDYVEQIY